MSPTKGIAPVGPRAAATRAFALGAVCALWALGACADSPLDPGIGQYVELDLATTGGPWIVSELGCSRVCPVPFYVYGCSLEFTAASPLDGPIEWRRRTVWLRRDSLESWGTPQVSRPGDPFWPASGLTESIAPGGEMRSSTGIASDFPFDWRIEVRFARAGRGHEYSRRFSGRCGPTSSPSQAAPSVSILEVERPRPTLASGDTIILRYRATGESRILRTGGHTPAGRDGSSGMWDWWTFHLHGTITQDVERRIVLEPISGTGFWFHVFAWDMRGRQATDSAWVPFSAP